MTILPGLFLESRANQQCSTSGMDCLNECLDKLHYRNFPWPVAYHYNERGFRDQPWPTDIEELQNSIWCLGDSFTVGLGSPLDHTWPSVLAKESRRRTVNVSMDGASNDWIARQAVNVLSIIKPNIMVIMWSYLQRRESPEQSRTDEERRLHLDRTDMEQNQDNANFRKCLGSVLQAQGRTKTIMFLVPNFTGFDGEQAWSNIKGPSWPQRIPKTLEEILSLPDFVQKELKQDFACWDQLLEYIDVRTTIDKNDISIVPQLDWARDGHHFDLVTSQWVVDQIMIKIAKHDR